MKQKRKITLYSGIGLLSMGILVGGLKMYDSTIDHTQKICPITKVSCFLNGDEKGSLHQQKEIGKLDSSVRYFRYPEDSETTLTLMASVNEYVDQNGNTVTTYIAHEGYTLNGKICTKVIDCSNESVLIIDNSKILKLHK